MSTTPVTGRLHLVQVPATDQDRSIAFYEALGFEKRADFPFGEEGRWIELYPPDGVAGIALPPGDAGMTGGDSGIILTCEDIDEAHTRLQAAGLDVDAEIAREGAPRSIRMGAVDVVGPHPAMFHVRDPDGHAVLIVQPGT